MNKRRAKSRRHVLREGEESSREKERERESSLASRQAIRREYRVSCSSALASWTAARPAFVEIYRSRLQSVLALRERGRLETKARIMKGAKGARSDLNLATVFLSGVAVRRLIIPRQSSRNCNQYRRVCTIREGTGKAKSAYTGAIKCSTLGAQ